MQLPDEVRDFLSAAPFASLCLALDLGAGPEAVLVVKGSRDLLEGLRQAGAAPEVGWVVHRTGWGPVVCLAVRSAADGAGDLLGEAYLDAGDPADRGLLASLARQPRLLSVFLGEELEVVWTPEIPWGEVERLAAEQAGDRAEELLERCAAPDFDRAREAFQDEVGLAALARRAFSA